MSKRMLITVAAISVLLAAPMQAGEIEGLPLHVEKLGDRGVRLWLGDYASMTAVSAVATQDGIVVIDTTDLPQVDAQYREIIAKELGRDDFAVLINTHEHGDHTLGNGVYADCRIVAHERAPQGILNRLGDSPRMLGWYEQNLPRMEAEIAEAETGEEKAARTEALVVAKARKAALEADPDPALPNVTFSDRMTLDMGDLTFELFYSGGLHTASDIFILVPEEGWLFTGDTMADIWKTESPGCLGAFVARQGVHHDFPLLLANWEALIARKDEIKDLIPGHWNGDITFEGFVNRYEYVKTLWDGIGEAVAADASFEEIYADFPLAERFPKVAESPGFNQRNHAASVLEIWREITGAESAADRLAARADEVGMEQALAECRAARVRDDGNLYFLEHEFNALGYRYLGENRIPDAKAAFELNVEISPESWNVYDSLAEANMAAGDLDRAVGLYEKSLELNPDNENAHAMLERIASERE
jgi:glyoxylase-like metal-dependent hydrolase (beta-lactamase superfamily II)